MTSALPKAGQTCAGRTFAHLDGDGADLTDIRFEDCAFDEPAFDNAVLGGARFVRCRLTRPGFAHADLRDSVFEACVFADPATQRGANFAFARLDEARFVSCDLTHARFESADLYAAGFESCNLLGARFGRARFHRTMGRTIVRAAGRFVDCNLELADLSDLSVPACHFARSRLREADLSGTDFEGADLTGADLFQAVIDGAKFTKADLRGAEISGLDLRRLAGYRDMKITVDQQFALLDALGLDVRPQ